MRTLDEEAPKRVEKVGTAGCGLGILQDPCYEILRSTGLMGGLAFGQAGYSIRP